MSDPRPLQASLKPRASPPGRRAPSPAGAVRALAAGRVARAVLVAALVVGGWQAVVLVAAPPPYILPGPGRVAAALVGNARFLAENALVTTLEIGLGLVLGVGLGVATAVAMAIAPAARRLLLPGIVVVQSLPVFALAPLLVLWLGFGLASKVVMASLVIFFPVASALNDGLGRTDPALLDLARLAGASRGTTLAIIRFPAALPDLVSGLRVAAAIAPIGAVIGEWVGAAAGLGFVMLHANARMQTDLMFAALAVLAVIAVALRAAIDRLGRRLVPWVEG